MMSDLFALPPERSLPASRLAAARTQLEEAASKRSWRFLGRWRQTGIVVGLGVGLSVGGVALANGVFSQPGAPSDTQLAGTVIATRTGTATIDLGLAPRRANGVSLTLTGLSVGTFRFPDGSTLGCSPSDLGHSGPRGCQSMEVVPLHAGQRTVTITTSANASWRLRAAYVNEVITPWKTNAHGQTYGVPNKHGFPDLLGVSFDRGRSGYVKSTDLNCAAGGNARTPAQQLARQKILKGRSVSVPVYESDGTTKIGTFIVGSKSPGTRSMPLSSLSCSGAGPFPFGG
jgi:hypothetical protein